MDGTSARGLLLPLCCLLALLGKGRAEGGRLISIPDIHGDIKVMKEALALVLPLQAEDKLVFTGDLVDRGPKPLECYQYSEELAQSYNVTRLTGNHEWVTMLGVHAGHAFSHYVQKEDLNSFGGWEGRMMEFSAAGDLGKLIRNGFDVMTLEQIPSDPLSRTLFVHAGVSLRTMQRYGSVQKIKDAGKQMLLNDDLESELLDEILQTRHLTEGNPERVCAEVTATLKVAQAERLVLGHTPTIMLGATPGTPIVRCGGRLLLTDVAMSRWMGGGMPAALILEANAKGSLSRIYIKHGRGLEMDVPIAEPLNNYKEEL